MPVYGLGPNAAPATRAVFTHRSKNLLLRLRPNIVVGRTLRVNPNPRTIRLMPFRIAIGECKCREPYRDRAEEIACELISRLIAEWRSRLPYDLRAVPAEVFDEQVVEGWPLTLGTHRVARDEGGDLVVFQVLVHTWRRPTFLSLSAVGRMYAEGLVVSESGDVSSAPDEEMWFYR